MKDVQELYNTLISDIEKQRALKQVSESSGNRSMALYHEGHISQAVKIANELVYHYGAKERI